MGLAERGAPAARDKLLQTAATVPPLSRILDRLLASLSKEDVLLAEISELAEKDTALAGNLLRTVNSSLYGMSGTVNSVRHALAILGLEKVRNIALTMNLVRLWRKDPGVPGWSSARFNLHSAATAIMADLLAQSLPTEYGEGAFTAGLFHDFGVLLVASSLPLEFGAVRSMAAEGNGDQESYEFRLMGITHSELSAAALQAWNLPGPIIEAVRTHHSPRSAAGPPVPLAEAVNAANRCVNRMGISVLEAHPESGKPPEEPLAALGLGEQAVRLLGEFQAEFENARSYIR